MALLLCAAVAQAQYPDREIGQLDVVARLYLDDVITIAEGRGAVELHLRAETRYGEPVETLRAVDLAIKDNGKLIDPSELELRQLVGSGRGAAVVVVLDRSQRSRAEDAFTKAQQALGRVIDASTDRDRIAVVTVADQVELLIGLGATRDELESAVAGVEASDVATSGVPLYDAIALALDELRGGQTENRRGFVIVFTGGADEGSQASLEDLIEAGRGSEFEPRIPVFTVGYSQSAESQTSALQALSEGTGAKSFQARSPIHLASLFQEIWRQMAHSYLVRYPAELDGEVHKIEVAVEGHSDMRMVEYPSRGAMIYLWWILGAVLVAIAGLVGYRLQRRNRLMGRLVFVGGQESGREVILRGPDVRIGALPDNDIVVGSGAVSRKHAVLRLRGGDIEIEDLETRNGTYVNGAAVRSTTLHSGDKIRIADVDMVYEK